MLPLLLLACAPAFDETRKDLDGFRLFALTARREPDGTATLRASTWSGEGAFHPTAPAIEWTIDGKVVTGGPVGPFTAHVRVESAAGEVEEGELVVAEDAAQPVVTDASVVLGGGGAALSLAVEGDSVTRWMSSRGAFVETGPHAADWTQAELPTEDEPVPGAGETGLTSIVALTLDGRGGNAVTWLDVATDPGFYVRTDGRLLPAEATVPEAGWYLATLSPADNHAGLVLTDLVPNDSGDPYEWVCEWQHLEASRLADGACGLDEALGARVQLRAEPWP